MELTLPALLARQVASRGSEIVLRKKDRGIWKALTWAELDAAVQSVRRALGAMDFGRGDVAAVLSETRPEAAQVDLGILCAGGASVAIHPDDDETRVGHILRSAGCRIVFVEDEQQLDKVLAVRGDCPALGRIVITDMKGLRDFTDAQSQSLDAFVATGNGRGDGFEPATPEDPALILFPPDGIAGMGRVLSHSDVMHLVNGAQGQLGLRAGDERLAVLRMADPTERILGLYAALAAGTISNYLENPETAVENLQQLKPTVLGADAEAWERLHARISGAAAAATSLQGALYRWAMNAARAGGPMGSLADLLVLRAVRRELGMTRLRLAYVGASPTPEVVAWAKALGIAIRQVTDPAEATDDRYRTLLAGAMAGG